LPLAKNSTVIATVGALITAMEDESGSFCRGLILVLVFMSLKEKMNWQHAIG